MDDKNAARHIAAIFGRSCREPGNDPGLDPALDSAAEVIARIRAEARAEALKNASEKLRSLLRLPENDSPDCDFIYDDAIKSAIAILADEPKDEKEE